MKQAATIEEIIKHLTELGAGNHPDNVANIHALPRYYLISLAEDEFMDLVFLQTETLSKIVPADADRRLKAVAQRASELPPTETNLGSNWDIAAMLARFRQTDYRQRNYRLPALVLRDTRSSECHWAPNGWYLQDGSHRALAYCMTILAGEIQYFQQLAFCATSKHFDRSP